MTRLVRQDWGLVKAHFEIEGVHWFPGVVDMLKAQEDAEPDAPPLPQFDVSFLQHPHRHIFKFDVKVQVHHDDRDIEFIQMSRLLRDGMLSLFPKSKYGCANFENRSCEMLANEVVNIFLTMWPQYTGFIIVEVSEDGENSSISKYDVTNQEEMKQDVSEHPVEE